jgi:class 3 adenylate cyclase
VIGDTVNLAERLEALCRTVVEDDAEVGALVSSVTAGMIDGAAGAHPVGRYNLPGRDEPIDVFRLHLD